MTDYVWDFAAPLSAWPQLLHGLGYTLLLAVLSFVLSCLIGALVCALRVSPVRTVSLLAAGYIELMRLTPLLIQMLWVYTSLALLTGIRLSPFQAGLLALSLNSGAFMAEVFRSGLQSVPRGQKEAAQALGMSTWQSLKRVVGPQTLRIVIPPLGSGWVSSFKDTSLLLVLGVPELMTQAQMISSATYRPLETFTIVGLVYLLLAYPQALLVERLYRRFRRT
jgi:polar amino acid transport system permease protein